MIDRKAYNSLSYTISIVGSLLDGVYQGCVVNSLQQLTSASPAQFAVTLNKYNLTQAAVAQTGAFSAVIAAADCPHEIINRFGYQSGRVTQKYAEYDTKTDEAGCPYITEGMCARLSFRVVQQVDLKDAVLFVAEVTEAEVLQEKDALTVDMFKNAGKEIPPNAPVYRTLDEHYGYRCTVCGYVHKSDTLPDDFRCPICKQPASKFEKL